jgi:hypothetical protein
VEATTLEELAELFSAPLKQSNPPC